MTMLVYGRRPFDAVISEILNFEGPKTAQKLKLKLKMPQIL